MADYEHTVNLGTFTLHKRVHTFRVAPGQRFILNTKGTTIHLSLAPDLTQLINLRISGIRENEEDPENMSLKTLYFELSPIPREDGMDDTEDTRIGPQELKDRVDMFEMFEQLNMELRAINAKAPLITCTRCHRQVVPDDAIIGNESEGTGLCRVCVMGDQVKKFRP